MRVSLSWIKISKFFNSEHESTTTINSYSLADLVLAIYDPNGNFVVSSNEIYTNTEIVEFVPTIAGNYTIKVINYTPSEYNAYFGVAWY